ncbi:hypothetical protein FXW07_07005 [Methanosarcina sp. DH1]|uniref:hypothetical protein n=1 Tax=Methanosarcina sp. DH1 TaxID=2605695 RepID=UPI001E338F17|nr:hypothetical protein [Methanosarcina sp. DH1]MCC4766369.1 hypothetical protein [Methanosarcina sp. DH1]
MKEAEKSEYYIQIDEGYIVAVPKNNILDVGDHVILFPHPNGEKYAINANFFEKIRSVFPDNPLPVQKLKLLIEVKL